MSRPRLSFDATDGGEGGGGDDVLRSALLRGALSVAVSDADIRRDLSADVDSANGGGGGGVGSGGGGSGRKSRASTLESILNPIETDYILRVRSTKTVKFDDASARKLLSADSRGMQDFQPYVLSKRYVDVRNLASSLRRRAEDIVKHYGHKGGGKSSPKKKKKASGSYFLSGLGQALATPMGLVQYATNSEPRKSNLGGELDAVFKGAKHNGSKKGEGDLDSAGRRGLQRRASECLHAKAPPFARRLMVGVDEFYEAIYSEKRQFRHKSNYEHVKTVAERRKAIVNKAFAGLIDALADADVASAKERSPDAVPEAVDELVGRLERFLLTDVVEQEDEEEEEEEKEEPSAFQAAADAKAEASVKASAVTTRRRRSLIDREQEEEQIQNAKEVVVAEPTEDDDASVIARESAEEGADEPTARVDGDREADVEAATYAGLLPEDPVDFAIVVALGALAFKYLEGRTAEVPLDLLVAFGAACGMTGYRLGGEAAAKVEKPAATRSATHRGAVSYAKTAAEAPPAKAVELKQEVGEGKENAAVARPHVAPPRTGPGPGRGMGGMDRRSRMERSSGSRGFAEKQRRESLGLLQASLKSMRDVKSKGELTGGEGAEMPAPPPPAKTFPKFPDGAAIGSHLNCWSSPPSSNFQVRGPNYLKDKKKVSSGEYLFPCRGCDLFLTDLAPTDMGRNRAILKGTLRDVPTFIVNYRLPWGVFLSYHEIPARFLPFLRRGHGHGNLDEPLPSTSDWSPAERAMCDFLLSDGKERDERWKMVPVVVEGPWVVKRVVGGKPAIVGQKLPVSYVYGPAEGGLAEYLEADLDIVSSAAARNILAVVRSYTQVLTIDLGYVVQGNKIEELPERMMLGLRLHGLDPLTAELLPEMEDTTAVPELSDDGYDTD
ncbi:hypothetical protein ACHAWF_014462 [Thalassiosira exigua]